MTEVVRTGHDVQCLTFSNESKTLLLTSMKSFSSPEVQPEELLIKN